MRGPKWINLRATKARKTYVKPDCVKPNHAKPRRTNLGCAIYAKKN